MKLLRVTHTPRKEQTPPSIFAGTKNRTHEAIGQPTPPKGNKPPLIFTGTKNLTRVAIGNSPNSEKRTSTPYTRGYEKSYSCSHWEQPLEKQQKVPHIFTGTKNRTRETIGQPTPPKENKHPPHTCGYEKSYPCSHWEQSKLRKRKQAPSPYSRVRKIVLV